jgi:preprotein translocase subunit YajC
MAQPLFFALLLGAMYMLLIRPQQARARRQRELITALAVGDDVITAGGMVGRIVALNDDRVTIRLAPGVDVEFLRGAIAQRVTPTAAEPAADDDPVVLDEPEDGLE